LIVSKYSEIESKVSKIVSFQSKPKQKFNGVRQKTNGGEGSFVCIHGGLDKNF